MVFFLNCYQITIEKLFAKITTVYKKPQGILLKLTLENLEISGNFVLEIGRTPCSRLFNRFWFLYRNLNLEFTLFRTFIAMPSPERLESKIHGRLLH